MARRAVSANTQRPAHAYVTPEGDAKFAKPTVDSLLKLRKAKAAKKKRVVIRHKREF